MPLTEFFLIFYFQELLSYFIWELFFFYMFTKAEIK